MAAPLDALLDLVGPFLFPVVVFAFGLAGYAILLVLGRRGAVVGGSDGSQSGNRGDGLASGDGGDDPAGEGGTSAAGGNDDADDGANAERRT